MTTSEQRMAALVAQLRNRPGLVEGLSGQEGQIAQQALAGQDVYQIAQEHQLSEAAVWDLLGRLAQAASGQAVEPVESGGLGSDTDPGVSGGYGDTGFGSLGNEPPFPVSEEPGAEGASEVEQLAAREAAALEEAIRRQQREQE